MPTDTPTATTTQAPKPMPIQRPSLTSTHSGTGPSTLDKTKAMMRHATPDSEALASSEDEQEARPQRAPFPSQPTTLAARRNSYFSEAPSQRKATSPGGRTLSNSSHLSFSIWNDAPALGSSSGLGANALLPTGLMDESSGNISQRRESILDKSIPFSIPLQPTHKNYRSQSYSVGQLEPESLVDSPGASTMNMNSHRIRAGQLHSSMVRRASRHSILSDHTSRDNVLLEQLQENADEDSSASDEAGVSGPHSQQQVNMQQHIAQLTIQNAQLQDAARRNALRLLGSNGSPASNLDTSMLGRFGNLNMNDSVLEEADNDTYGHARIGYHNGTTGGLNEYSPTGRGNLSPTESRLVDNLRKAQWQSSLGFEGLQEVSQSRRHSFADVLNPASIGVQHDGQRGTSAAQQLAEARNVDETTASMHAHAAEYFNPANRLLQQSNSPFQNPSGGTYNEQYRVPQAMPAPQSGGPLYLVTFKNMRAEFYTIPTGYGLTVKKGDLVIVEADRGTDLGTVAEDCVDWGSARALKEQYLLEQYKCTLMFSTHPQNQSLIASAALPSTGGITGGRLGSAGQNAGLEIKPKMIKRHAQSHEAFQLREKEANEAKAKRTCQQKIAEHHLQLEILDAEFQLYDWRKLTFFFIADAYQNFNSLVTDLFKIYKTRIWMHDINVLLNPGAGPNPSGQRGGPPMPTNPHAVDRSRQPRHGFVSPTGSDNSQGPYDQPWNGAAQTANGIPPSLSSFYQGATQQQQFAAMQSAALYQQTAAPVPAAYSNGNTFYNRVSPYGALPVDYNSSMAQNGYRNDAFNPWNATRGMQQPTVPGQQGR